MHRIKRVMVATDMSLLARQAEARSAMLVRELGCELLDVGYSGKVQPKLAHFSLQALISCCRRSSFKLLPGNGY